MKKSIKKLVATAMAFTLLGTGINLTKTIAPNTQRTLSAHAVQCMHSPKQNDTGWIDCDYKTVWFGVGIRPAQAYVATAECRTVTDYCEKCGMTFNCTVTKRSKFNW